MGLVKGVNQTNKKDGYTPIDLLKVKTYPIKDRKNKVKIEDFAKVCSQDSSFKYFINSLPKVLAGNDFRNIVKSIASAYKESKPVIFAMGGHVIKCGLGPIIIDLMKRGILTAIAMNGSGSIHDFEIALIGETSEDVADSIEDGSFGMAEETGRLMNEAIKEGVKHGMGMGESLGRKILEIDAPFKDLSVLASAIKFDVPLTIHVAIGTDIIHQHGHADGASIGEASFIDFRILTSCITDLGDGGVFINMGSAVLLPEVFLKALSVARNLGYPVFDFTTSDFDMIKHYRPSENVVKRPTIKGGTGYSITGHHELMIPLLHRSILEELGDKT